MSPTWPEIRPHAALRSPPSLVLLVLQVIRGVGGFDHDSWRSCKDERRTEAATNFIDGDLVEQFLDLDPAKAQEVVAAVWPNGEVGVQQVQQRLEELQRLH